MSNKNQRRFDGIKPLWILLLAILSGVMLLGLWLISYRPDRPVPTIEPGSSSGPAFVVQVIRPRLGLPVGGLLPPQIFGLEARLLFDAETDGARIDYVSPERIELSTEDWHLLLITNGRLTFPDTQLTFPLIFEDELTKIRCRPADPVVGTFAITPPVDARPGELSGNFDIELAHCEYAESSEPLGWPASPLVLHGSFDRLPLHEP